MHSDDFHSPHPVWPTPFKLIPYTVTEHPRTGRSEHGNLVILQPFGGRADGGVLLAGRSFARLELVPFEKISRLYKIDPVFRQWPRRPEDAQDFLVLLVKAQSQQLCFKFPTIAPKIGHELRLRSRIGS